MHNLFNTLDTISTKSGKTYRYYSLKKLAQAGFELTMIPVSIRIMLESMLRNYDNVKITQDQIENLASWEAHGIRKNEIPFVVARVVLQDFTGVPLLCDLAAMRSAAAKLGHDPKIIEPSVTVDLVIDHSVQVDHYGNTNALRQNMELEFVRNHERYQFMKWGMQAFNTFSVVPPGIGIVHQVNLEYLFRGIHQTTTKDGIIIYPDTLVGTDSHTTMINGVGVVAWGVGGIEAEAGMLGQPVYILTPDVIGVELTGQLNEGIMATDLVLTITQMLRQEKVVGKFVEFIGTGAASLSITDRATIANMAPEYGATMGFFPIDSETVRYMRVTGKSEEECELFETYFQQQGLFGMPDSKTIKYTKLLHLDLTTIKPSLAGPKRPQDRIDLNQMKEQFNSIFTKPFSENGFNKNPAELTQRFDSKFDNIDLGHGDVLIAAITSCTNTSNPTVLLAAGILAKKAVAKGLKVHPRVKTSLAPGSRVVTEYLINAGLQPYLDQLGFNLAGYGCTTCIGNSGELRAEFNQTISKHDLIACAVLSGNRNFEARIHHNIRGNFLASPPLVVAFALAGRVNIDLDHEPLGTDNNNQAVYLKDIWPSSEEINALMGLAQNPEVYRRLYSDFTKNHDLWNNIVAPTGKLYDWPDSTYIAQPPFFDQFKMEIGAIKEIHQARALMILGNSVTTDHISPAGSFKANSPAGKYLTAHGIAPKDFNSYGSRRGNHEVMIRGTFANPRIKNLMSNHEDNSPIEGGVTYIDGQLNTIYDAANNFLQQGIPTIIFAGEEYGTGSSRDWAAKGTYLLGVKAVIARSFERIHRSNLVGMGVLPLQFKNQDQVSDLDLTGAEFYDILGVNEQLKAQQDLELVITYANGNKKTLLVLCRIDTPIEVEYYRHGGILSFVLRDLLTQDQKKSNA